VSPVMRRMHRPLGDVRLVGELLQLAALAQLAPYFRSSGAVRDEEQPPHGVVHARQVVERMMVDGRVIRHLPQRDAGAFVGECSGLGRDALYETHVAPPAVLRSRHTVAG